MVQLLNKNILEEEEKMSMFCFQCEQTAGGKGCTKVGVCGKKPEVANMQDELTSSLIELARASKGRCSSEEALKLMLEGLFTTVTNVSFDEEEINVLKKKIQALTISLGVSENFDSEALWTGNEDVVSLRSTLLLQ